MFVLDCNHLGQGMARDGADVDLSAFSSLDLNYNPCPPETHSISPPSYLLLHSSLHCYLHIPICCHTNKEQEEPSKDHCCPQARVWKEAGRGVRSRAGMPACTTTASPAHAPDAGGAGDSEISSAGYRTSTAGKGLLTLLHPVPLAQVCCPGFEKEPLESPCSCSPAFVPCYPFCNTAEIPLDSFFIRVTSRTVKTVKPASQTH